MQAIICKQIISELGKKSNSVYILYKVYLNKEYQEKQQLQRSVKKKQPTDSWDMMSDQGDDSLILTLKESLKTLKSLLAMY